MLSCDSGRSFFFVMVKMIDFDRRKMIIVMEKLKWRCPLRFALKVLFF